MRLTGNFEKNSKKNSEFFFSIFSFLRAFVVSSCRKSGFRVFLSLRYGADLGRSRLVSFFFGQTTDLIAYVPLFTETDKTTQTTQAKSGQCKLSPKGPPFHF